METLNYLLVQNKRTSVLLTIMITFCCLLFVIRATNTQTLMYGFLLWNLFLAGLPLLFSSILLVSLQLREHKLKLMSSLFFWLLFLPNSFYIITDFEHLSRFPTVPFWFDLILISSFALTGMFAGLLSLLQVEKIISSHFSTKLKVPFIMGILYLSGFGVYLGRYYRFNSWNVLNEPITLLNGIIKGLTTADAQNFTLGFGTFLLLLYFFSKNITLKK